MDYEKLISAGARDMRPSGIRKFFDIAAQIEGCISLGVGEPDFKTPWAIRDAGIRSLEKGEVDVEGQIDSLTYSEITDYHKMGASLLGRLFK